MRVEDPVNRRGGLKLGSVLILNQNLYFEMASNSFLKVILVSTGFYTADLTDS
jgi:hypothetical protein